MGEWLLFLRPEVAWALAVKGRSPSPWAMFSTLCLVVLATPVRPTDRCPDLPNCLRACSHGAAHACRQVGEMYARGRGVPRGMGEAGRRYAVACKGGDAKGCARQGWQLLHGVGVKADRSQARALLKRACDGGWGGGCADLGWIHATGTGVKVSREAAKASYVRARKVYEAGCERDPEACTGLADLYLSAVGGPAEGKRAALFAGKACETGDPDGCAVLAGLEKDVKRMLVVLEGACESGSLRACRSLGARLAVGVGTKRNPARAERLLKAACDGGDPLGCSSLGQLYLRVKQYGRAKTVTDLGCTHGEADACYVRGLMHAKGQGGEVDVAASLTTLGKACLFGHGRACLVVGEGQSRGAPGVAPNPAGAHAAYVRGCALGERQACERLEKR